MEACTLRLTSEITVSEQWSFVCRRQQTPPNVRFFGPDRRPDQGRLFQMYLCLLLLVFCNVSRQQTERKSKESIMTSKESQFWSLRTQKITAGPYLFTQKQFKLPKVEIMISILFRNLLPKQRQWKIMNCCQPYSNLVTKIRQKSPKLASSDFFSVPPPLNSNKFGTFRVQLLVKHHSHDLNTLYSRV